MRELAGEEIPAVEPIAFDGIGTLATFAGFRFAVYPNCGGRAPELEDRAIRERLGRFIGRIHAVGGRTRFAHRPALDRAELRPRAARLAACARLHSARSRRSVRKRRRHGARGRAPMLRARGHRARAAPARRLPWRQCPVAARRTACRAAFRRFRRQPHGTGAAGPVDAALRRSRRDDPGARRSAWPATRTSRPSTGASSICSKPCARCGSCTMRPGWRGAGTIPRSPPRSPGSIANATGRIESWNCASRLRRWTSRRWPSRCAARRRRDGGCGRCARPDRHHG